MYGRMRQKIQSLFSVHRDVCHGLFKLEDHSCNTPTTVTKLLLQLLNSCHHSSSPATQDSYNTEKALAWLTAAHAEERALRQALKGEVEATQVSVCACCSVMCFAPYVCVHHVVLMCAALLVRECVHMRGISSLCAANLPVQVHVHLSMFIALNAPRHGYLSSCVHVLHCGAFSYGYHSSCEQKSHFGA